MLQESPGVLKATPASISNGCWAFHWIPRGWSQLLEQWALASSTGKDWRQKEKGTTEDEKIRWHHRLGGHEKTPGVSDGQGSLPCCSPWGRSRTPLSDWTELSFQWGAQAEAFPCTLVFYFAGPSFLQSPALLHQGVLPLSMLPPSGQW